MGQSLVFSKEILKLFDKQIIKQMHTTTQKSDRDEVEYGFFLCKRKSRLVKGRTIIGDEYHIPDYLWEKDEVQCPSGTLEVGSFHTHSNIDPYPSQMDIAAATFEDHLISCIGGLKQVKCWDLRGKTYSRYGLKSETF